MNCVELEQSLAEIEDGSSAAQRAHLKTCRACSVLVADLNLIAASAIELREAEPSPRVWNSIETALRQEGLIRPQRASHSSSLLPSFGSRWGWGRWMVPAAAVLLIAVGIYVRPHSQPETIAAKISQTINEPGLAGLNDSDLAQEIAEQSPALQAQFAENLRRVNEYIADAKGTVDENPNDEEAQKSLMDAYQEKAMLFELAMDRSQ